MPKFAATAPNAFWERAARVFIANKWHAFLPEDLAAKYMPPPAATPAATTPDPPETKLSENASKSSKRSNIAAGAAASSASAAASATPPSADSTAALTTALAQAMVWAQRPEPALLAARAFYDALPLPVQKTMVGLETDARAMWVRLSTLKAHRAHHGGAGAARQARQDGRP